MGKTIGVIAAMSAECRQVAGLLVDARELRRGPHTFLEGRLGTARVALLQCGIGKVNAAAGAANMMMSFSPDCVVSTGVAGGVDSRLAVGDVVAGAEVRYHDVSCGPDCDPGQVQGLPALFPGDPGLLARAAALDGGARVRPGLICTGDQFITSRAELDGIKRRHPDALAVDMESAAVAQVCHLWGVPFLSFRVVSDTPGAENHFGQYLDFWATMADRSFRVTRAFLSSL